MRSLYCFCNLCNLAVVASSVLVLTILTPVITIAEQITPIAMPAQVSANPKDGAEMVWVPAGDFLMGSNVGDIYDEKPQHRVYLDGYWIYKREVTVAQYRQFCSETGRAMPKEPAWGWKDDHPVMNVTWQDAKDYTKWADVSLPSEAQWEKAARGTDGREYPWGADWDASKCNDFSSGANSTQPVGSYPAGASPYGCLDMAANVWEWCADWYSDRYYSIAPSKNPVGPSNGTYRIVRGGGWSFDGMLPTYFRCAYRSFSFPTYHDIISGFRCTKTP